MTTQRILDWSGVYNARDVGGLDTRGDGRIRPGALVRSDVLSRLAPEGRAALVAHGVRTIVDVRSEQEVALDRDAYPFRDADSEGIDYLNVPFTVGRDEKVADEIHARYQRAQSREELNRIDLDSHSDGIAAICRAVANARPGGVLIHCHAGKDRTGLTVALLLALVGVTDDDIADDYALTSVNLEPLISDWLNHMSDDEHERSRLRALSEPRREAMLDTLAYLRDRYGSARQYLLSAGITEGEIDRLRARLVEP